MWSVRKGLGSNSRHFRENVRSSVLYSCVYVVAYLNLIFLFTIMPSKKKQSRNAFFFFMQSLRPQLQRQGVTLENGNRTLAEFAGPQWAVSVCAFSLNGAEV